MGAVGLAAAAAVVVAAAAAAVAVAAEVRLHPRSRFAASTK